MNALRDLVSQFLTRVGRMCNQTKQQNKPKQIVSSDEKVAQIQEAIQNGEEVRKVTDIKTGRATLRKTLHDMPVATSHKNNFGKERHWFDKAEYDPRYSGKPSNTMNRLEAFLSNTDPDQLKALDPQWIQGLVGAPDDRPQPKQEPVNLPKFKRAPVDEVRPTESASWQEGALSESIS